MDVHEALEYLEDLSSEDDLSDNEDFIWRGRLVILPPNDEGDRDTNEDSGDENELLPTNLNRIQLSAGATVDLSTSSGNISLGAGDEEEVVGPSVDVTSKRNKGSKGNAFLSAWHLPDMRKHNIAHTFWHDFKLCYCRHWVLNLVFTFFLGHKKTQNSQLETHW